MLKECELGVYRTSLVLRRVNVAKSREKFAGRHRNAAGCTLAAPGKRSRKRSLPVAGCVSGANGSSDVKD